ncbi:MAG TPA: glycosyltransferase family 39 protein [Gemmatimonadaceae bacterium]|nr:glycosyltransferase family 39 protein [Gemmatimonadaceae bacterium]
MTAPNAGPATTMVSNRTYWPIVAVIFVIALIVRVPTFTQPWVGVHNAWGGAYYSNVARNFDRYGLETKLAPIVNTGVVDPAEFDVYYHHPVLSMWVTAVNFKILGEREWVARLAPLVFAMLTLAMLFVLARAAYGPGTALVALGVLAVLPADAYYATHLDPYGSMAMFFMVASVDAYRRWHASNNNKHLGLCTAAIVLGCWTSWYSYLVVPGLVLHAWFTHDREWRKHTWMRLAVMPAACIAVFAAFILHRKLGLPESRGEVYGSLAQRLLIRSVDLPVDRIEVAKTHLRYIWNLYTIPLIALIGAWCLFFASDVVRKRARTADWYVVIFLSVGVLYGLAFPGHLLSHDYFARAYAPGAALACAIALTRIVSISTPVSVRTIATGVACALVAVLPLMRTNDLYAGDDRRYGTNVKAEAHAMAAHTSPRERVIMPIGDDRVLAYYADRRMTYEISTPAKVDSVAASLSGRAIFVVPNHDAVLYRDVLVHLRTKYSEEHAAGMSIFATDKPIERR